MRWRSPWLLKLVVARAVSDPNVQTYCETTVGEKVDVAAVINGSDDFVLKVFYAIFEPRMGIIRKEGFGPATHEWILKRLVDGLGMRFPRELIHLGNMAVVRQRELDRIEGKHQSERLISSKALRSAFEAVSEYRCETYLNAEFPHLAEHFNCLRGKETSVFTKDQLLADFKGLDPKGEDAIRTVQDVGVISPIGKNADSAKRFEIPLLYRSGLGIVERRTKGRKRQMKAVEERPQVASSEQSRKSPVTEEANIPSSQFR
jgi:hypothetical protein